MRNLTSVPFCISEDIISFCHSINAKTTPSFISSIPFLNAQKGECFTNVSKALLEHQNSCYGWIIWQTSTYLLQAEFHCVVASRDGELTCVTPYNRKYEKILFLPDPSYMYTQQRVPTHYHAIGSDNETKNFIDALEAISELEVNLSTQEAKDYINHPDNRAKRTNLLETMHGMENAVSVFEKMVLKDIGANSLCICGSGKKFKKCCGS